MNKRLSENNYRINWSKYTSKTYISLRVDGMYTMYNSEYDDWSGSTGDIDMSAYNVSNVEINTDNFDLWEWLQKHCDFFESRKQYDFCIFSGEDGRITLSLVEDADGDEDETGEYLVDYDFYVKINGKLIEEDDLYKMLPDMGSC